MTTEPRRSGLTRVELRAGPPRKIGSLIFGVGVRDEPAYLSGITHLAEHLILRRIGNDDVHRNGWTAIDRVGFVAGGEPAEIESFLRRIAEAIFSIREASEEELQLELGIVESEDVDRFNMAFASSATLRFGMTGYGLSRTGTPSLPSITLAEVVAWIEYWFVVENALLVLDDPGSGQAFELALPSNDEFERSDVVDAGDVQLPALVPIAMNGVGVSMRVPNESVLLLNFVLVEEFNNELRTKLGLIYSVSVQHMRLDDGTTVIEFFLDPAPHRVGETVQALSQLLCDLIDETREFDGVARAVRYLEETAREPETPALDELSDRIDNALFALPASRHAEFDRARESATQQDASALVDRAWDTLIVTFASNAIVPMARKDLPIHFDRFEPVDTVTLHSLRDRIRGTKQWYRRGAGFFSGNGAFVTRDALLVGGNEDGWAVDLTDPAAVYRFDGRLLIVSASGRHFALTDTDWISGEALIKTVISKCPPERVRDLRRPARRR